MISNYQNRKNLTNLIENYVFSNTLKNVDFEKPLVINTVNAHSYCLSTKDEAFNKALLNSDILLADGVSIVIAARLLTGKKIEKIAGADLHNYLLKYANNNNKKVFYLGSTNHILDKILKRIKIDYPNIRVSSYSPPFKNRFTENDNHLMTSKVNSFEPDILFIGMTAPKQEKWVAENIGMLNTTISASIGAVFDFYSGNIKRAPKWMRDIHLEWFFRFCREPKRMWQRYVVNNNVFMLAVFREKFL